MKIERKMSALFGSGPKGEADAGSQCPVCAIDLAPGRPYCPGCGSRLDQLENATACAKCSALVGPVAKFCAQCGYGLVAGSVAERRTSALSVPVLDSGAQLLRLDEDGQQLSSHPLVGDKTTIGREGADIDFPDDPYLSPRHAELSFRDGRLYMRDLGSRNGTWHFIQNPHKLRDGDLVLVGSQILQYRRLGYPGPHPPEADATRRLGSLTPSADIATLTQLRGDGSARDVVHLSPGRNVTIGRDEGDWIFSYDPSMSGLHAQIRSEDADFILMDAGSRNGVAVSVRGEVELQKDSRILVGDKMLRVDIP
jgi:pSer/pThr/pTyr-binding forkhead associated (FHA) protein